MSSRRGGERDEELPADVRLTSIGDAVSRYVARRGLGSAATFADIVSAWPQAAGAALARHARPVMLREAELVVEVDDQAWGTEVRLGAERLLENLAAGAGRPVARQLSVRIRPRRESR